jgi:transcriptional regulator GlxA family with amidase domain
MSRTDEPIVVAGVIFPKFELLDLYGPYELFGMLQERVSIVTAAEQAGTVISNQGPKVVADLAMADVSPIDVLLIPGGWGTRHEVTSASFVRSLHALAGRAGIVATVCTGAALLAKTGLLDGRKATTNKRAFHWVAAQSDRVIWVNRARWVEDGQYFTSSGVSAGMDMTLAIIGRLFGRDEAEKAAHLAEYTWHREAGVDPFATSSEVQV